MKIRTKLGIFPITLAIIMLIVSLLIIIFISKSILQKQIGNHLWTTAQSRARNIETLLNDYEKTVQVLSAGIPFTNMLDPKIDYTRRIMECNLRIKRTIEVYPCISRIRILDINGIVIASSHEDVGFELSAEEIFIKGKENVYIGEIHKSLFTKNLVLSVSAPIIVRDTFSGVVIINFNVEEKLHEIVTDRTGLGKTGEVYLVNKDGYLLTPSRFIDVTIFETKINIEQVRLFILKDIEEGFSPEVEKKPTIYTNFTGRKVLSEHYFIPQMQWSLIAEFDVKETNKPMNKLAVLLIIIFSILLITTIIVVIVISKGITLPIEELHKGTEEIIKGNLAYKVGTKREDEIGQFSRAFDSMTARLVESQEELEKYAEKLNEKVKERTAELDKKIAEIEQQRIATINIANDLEKINVTLQDEINERKRVEESLRESEEKYRLLAENTLDCVWKMDQDLKFTYINQSILPLLGFTREEWIGSTLVEHCSEKEFQHFISTVEETLQNKDTYSAMFELFLFHKNGSEVQLEILGKILLNENEQIIGFQGNARNITERKRAENVQRALYGISNATIIVSNMRGLYTKIREYLGNVIDTTNFTVALYDEKTDRISLAFNVNEKDDFKTFPAGMTLTSRVIKTGKSLFATKQLQDKLAKQGKIEIIGTPTEIWLGVPLKIENKVIGVIAVQSYDDPNLYTEKDIEILSFVSEEIAHSIKHKQSNEQIMKELNEKEILLAELYHRTKNNMQVICSILKLQASRLEDQVIINILKDLENKIYSMALVHQKLLAANNLSHLNLNDYFRDLLIFLKQSYIESVKNISIHTDMEDINVLIDTAVPLGIVFNELISNVIKHSFPNNESGEIKINLYFTPQKEIVLEISDNGIGLPKGFDIKKDINLGLEIVINLVEHQLDGKINFISRNGLHCKIIIKKELYKPRV